MNVIWKFILISASLVLVSFQAPAQIRSDLRLFSDSFISPSFEATQKTDYQFVGMGLKSHPASQDAVKLDIEGAVAFGAPLLNYLNISEFYLQTNQSASENLIVGRKHVLWNELDTRWDMGLWEPLFKWNPLSPEQQGLTGLFWQSQKEHYAVTIFASPVFLPDQGPTFEISDGQFVRGNPWFRRPPESVKIFEESTSVDYRFERPSETQIILQTSYGAKLAFGHADGFMLQMSYMYKPANQMALGYDGKLNTATLRGEIDLKPQTYYHTLSGFDISHKYENFRYGLSTVLDRPQKDLEYEEKWTHPVFSDAVLVSPFAEYITPGYTLGLQALHISGGQVHEEGEMASSVRAPLTLRYPYQQAYKATLETRTSFGGLRRLQSRLAYTFSDKNDFSYVQFTNFYRWSSLWSTFAELELVKAGEQSLENQNIIAQFKNHDRFLIGAAYVF